MKRRTWQPTPDQLVCRDLQHAWDQEEGYRRGKGYVRVLRCDRCGSKKRQTLSNDGFILSSSMDYPPGYLRNNEGRLTRMDRAALRVRNIAS
jgi:hypothetical protein